MNADAHFVIGRQHRVCEDYAIAGKTKGDGRPFVVLCDGCSSSPNSDFGARLLARAAALELMEGEIPVPPILFRGVVSTARSYSRTLQLPLESLSATLLVAGVTSPISETPGFYGMIVGDGVYAHRMKETGLWFVYLYSFASGAPYYLRYSIDPDCSAKWYQEFKPDVTVENFTKVGEGWALERGKGLSLPWRVDAPWFTHLHEIDEIDLVVMMSDGVTSFTKPTSDEPGAARVPVPVTDIFDELLGFKGFGGSFVQRRMNKAFQAFAKKDWQNFDDVSVVALYLGD